MEIGSKGLAEARLTIPQACSVSFEVHHKDEDGHAVDHSASTIHMALQRMSGEAEDLSACCSGSAAGIAVTIPAEVSAELTPGIYLWDMIAELQSGETIRLVYGQAEVVDTYALDGSE